MKILTRFFLLIALIFFLSGCDQWDDLVDSISGSGDDNPASTEEAATTDTEAAADTDTPTGSEETTESEDTTELKDTEESEGTAESDSEEETSPEDLPYESRYHHTATGSSDGGKSLILCPGQHMNFDSCSVGDIDIPMHADDHGRETYWNMKKEPAGDIICEKGDKKYKYRANQTIVMGNCR